MHTERTHTKVFKMRCREISHEKPRAAHTYMGYFGVFNGIFDIFVTSPVSAVLLFLVSRTSIYWERCQLKDGWREINIAPLKENFGGEIGGG